MANKSSSATNINPKLKRTIKYTGIAIGIPVALIIVLSLLLYFPPFQNWAVSKASAIASEKMGMRVSVGHVRLAFPLDLALEDVRAFEQNDSVRGKTDTVAIVSRAVANVQLLPLFHKQVMVDELSLRDMQLNTTHFVSDLRVSGKIGELKVKAHGIDLSKEHVRVNRAILNNANLLVELSDTAKKDTAKTANFWKINLDEISIRNTAFALHTWRHHLRGVAHEQGKGARCLHGSFQESILREAYRLGWRLAQLRQATIRRDEDGLRP